MAKWANHKMRINEESGRKSEAMVYTTLFNQRKIVFDRFKKKKKKKQPRQMFKMRSRAPTLDKISIKGGGFK